MPRADDMPLDPDIAAELELIDATLAGEPVDPAHAELAELALLLVAERPEPAPDYLARLDDRAAARFVSGGPGASGAGDGAAQSEARPTRVRSWWRRPFVPAVAGTALVAAVVTVMLVDSGGGGSATNPVLARPAVSGAGAGVARAPAPVAQSSTTSASGAAPGAASAASGSASAPAASPSGSAPAPAASPSAPASSAELQPPANGRRIVQSAQLSLTAAPAHIDDVAQEVFNVVGLANGIVNSSNVTASSGTDGYAQFQLSVPSDQLPHTMAALSRLRYASVASRTDTTQDVNDQYLSLTHRLADARALRTALLQQLARATSAQQIASLKAQIQDAEASIAGDEAALRGLTRRINFSQISLSINAAAPVPASVGAGRGFTVGHALHDAGRVLSVAAAVAIVALAVLLPMALLVALGLWIAARVRRYRREQALDLA